MRSGFVKVRVHSINPTEDFIEKNQLDVVDYTSNVMIVFESNKGEYFTRIIPISDNEVYISKNGSYLYVNCIGDSLLSDSEDNLWDSFKEFQKVLNWQKDGKVTEKYVQGSIPYDKDVIGKKEFKISRRGESDLLYLLKMIEVINVYDPTTNVFFNFDKLLQGDASELNRRIKDVDKDFHFIIMITLDKNNNEVVFNKYLSLNLMKDINNDCNIAGWNIKEWNLFVKELDRQGVNYQLSKLDNYININKKEFSNTDSDY